MQKKLSVSLRFITIIQKGSNLIFKANDHEVFQIPPSKSGLQNVTFDIPSHYIDDGKLQLIFRDTSGVLTSTLMGIFPFELTITEK